MDITSVLSGAGASAGAAGTDRTTELGKDAFMKLLVAQMKNQDPLEPVQNSDFVAQLATFSNLEQLTTMSESLGSMVTLGRVSQASELIGHRVEFMDAETGLRTPGIVSGVSVEGSNVMLDVGGKKVELGQVVRITA